MEGAKAAASAASAAQKSAVFFIQVMLVTLKVGTREGWRNRVTLIVFPAFYKKQNNVVSYATAIGSQHQEPRRHGAV